MTKRIVTDEEVSANMPAFFRPRGRKPTMAEVKELWATIRRQLEEGK
jgi:hypothetical protein